MQPSQRVTLIIKNPALPDGFVLEDVPLDTTLAQLQGLITQKYPGNPAPAQQTLIYAGKVLKDGNVTIQQLVKPLDSDGGAHNFHLVIKQPVGSTSSDSVPAPPAPAPAPPAPVAQAPASTSTVPNVISAVPIEVPPQSAHSPEPAVQAEQVSAAFPGVAAAGLPPYLYFNPVIATAYQAAYTAALAAGMCVQQQQQQAAAAQPTAPSDTASTSTGTPAPPSVNDPTSTLTPAMAGASAAMAALRPMTGYPMQSIASTQAHLATLQAMASMYGANGQAARQLQAQQQDQQRLLQSLAGLTGQQPAVTASQHQLIAALLEQGVPATLAMMHATGDVTYLVLGGEQHAAHGNAGVRARRGAAAVMLGGGQPAHRPAARPRRQRVFTLRISMRALLQMLVFGMVLYQHFTWRRFITLGIIAIALWIASLAPLRRFVANLHAPPPPAPAPAPPVPQPGGEGNAAAGEAGGDAAAGAAAQPGGAPPAQRPATLGRPRGILGEIMVLVIGFITSLLPAWNINPEDAAAFAAAEAMEAREQQQAAANARGGAGAGAGAAPGGANQAEQEGQAAAAAGGDEDHPHQD